MRHSVDFVLTFPLSSSEFVNALYSVKRDLINFKYDFFVGTDSNQLA